MPPRDPEFDVVVGSDRLTIPCYFAKGYDDPGLLEWRQDHPDWFVAGTWTSQSSATDARQPRSTAAGGATDPAVPQPPSIQPDRPARSLAATRASVGTGRTIPPLDPSTISLADFQAVAAKPKQQQPVKIGSTSVNAEQTEPILDAGSATVRPWGSQLPLDVDPNVDVHGSVHTVAHTNPEGGVPLVLNDGTQVLDRSGKPMLVPPTVDVDRNVRIGRLLSREWVGARIFDMASLLRPGGDMDYQRTHGSGSNNPLFNNINRSYIAFGNFNFGVVAAAAGLSLEDAEIAAGLANIMGDDRGGPHGTNPTTLPYIIEGFEAYKSGKVGH